MKVTVGGVVVSEQPLSLSNKWNEVMEDTERLIESKNRQIRRSKPMRKVLGVLGFISALGVASVAKAEESGVAEPVMADLVMQKEGFFGHLANKVIEETKSDVAHNVKDTVGLGSIAREDSLVWKMNDWLKDVLLNTQDFFDNSQVLTIFNSIWYICMSFVMLIISKKGFDMVKARVLGTSTLGLSELIIRLLACVVMTFLSLDIMQLGIEASNLTMNTLFKLIESNLIPYSALENTNSLGLLFWLIGYMLMFVILGIQYWIRQITIVILGCITPIANTSWVVDGGQMLGTLIREFITLLCTPLVHGLILGIGSILTFEVTTMTGNSFIDGMNSILIGFSTMFLMVFTPTFLRKFTTGSANPVKWALNMGKGTYGNAIKLAKLMKR